jgi:hypothetical protein
MPSEKTSETSSAKLSGHLGPIETQVIGRALSDKAFRGRLLTDPRGALEELGLKIPPEINIHVMEEDSKNYYLVLPPLELFGRDVSELPPRAVPTMAAATGDFYTEYDSHNSLWTGCASGQSGCVATNGCTVLMRLAQGAASGGTPEALQHCATHFDH